MTSDLSKGQEKSFVALGGMGGGGGVPFRQWTGPLVRRVHTRTARYFSRSSSSSPKLSIFVKA